jgi:hypothetical protein
MDVGYNKYQGQFLPICFIQVIPIVQQAAVVLLVIPKWLWPRPWRRLEESD